MTKTVSFRAVFYLALLTMLSMPCAADAASGREIAEEHCSGCHGTLGVSANDLIPNLRCQKKKYLVRQLQRFLVSGHNVKDLKGLPPRSDVIMDDVAKSLNYGDIAKLANYYASELCRE